MTSSPVTLKFAPKTAGGANIIYPQETDSIKNYASGTFTTNTFLNRDEPDNASKFANVEAHDTNPVQPMAAGQEIKNQYFNKDNKVEIVAPALAHNKYNANQTPTTVKVPEKRDEGNLRK